MKTIRSQTKNSRYFLQIKLLSLTLAPSHHLCTSPNLSPLLITIKLYKGIQKLDQIKQPIKFQSPSTAFERSLDFYTGFQEFNMNKSTSYRIVVEELDNNKIGEINLDVSPVIAGFMKRGEAQVDKVLEVGEDLRIETRIFVEKTKEELSRSVCSFSEARSVYKTRTEPNYSVKDFKGYNMRPNNDSQGSEKNKNSNTRESNDHPSSKNIIEIEGQSQLLTEAEEQVDEQANNMFKKNKGDWNDQQFDSISVIHSKEVEKKKKSVGQLSTSTVVTVIIIFLCLLALFIVKIEDQKGELSRIIKITRRVLARTESTL